MENTAMKKLCPGMALLVLLLGGCAFRNPRNTPLLTTLDKHVAPRTMAAKVALGLVFVPAGVTAGVLDIAAVHPAHSIVLGAEDTWKAVWAEPSGGFVEQSLMFLPKAAVTPVAFAFCWLGESLFDLRPEEAGGGQQ